MNRFDRIEKRISGIFEASNSILPWADQSPRLIQRLCEALEQYFSEKDIDEKSDPPAITITLNPNTLNNWNKRPDWEETVKETLILSSQELGVILSSSPSISLVTRNSLPENEVIIRIYDPKTPVNKTEAIPLSPRISDDEQLFEPTEKPCLIIQGDKTIALNRPVINIGRKSSNNIVINDLRISRTHAQIRKVQEEYIIFDIGSTGGTFVNGTRIDHHVLRPGDVISLAGYTMIFTREQAGLEDKSKGKTSEIKSANDQEIN